MLVLANTCIWSLALRRKSNRLTTTEVSLREELHELVDEGRIRMLGPIRQELLSGIREQFQYERLREYLRAFSDEPLGVSDYELAAKLCNRCRSAGVAGSSADFLICAVALGRKWEILTFDRDFDAYRRILGIALHRPRS